MKLTSNWKEEIKKFFNITYVDNIEKLLEDHSVIWTTRCSKTKGKQTDKEIPRNFYLSQQNIAFYEFCESFNLNYGIISDLYGLHLMKEYLDFYDVHPSKLSTQDKEKLGKIIERKCKENGYKKIVYWNSSPFMSRPYFEMLSYVKDIEVFYITKLDRIKVKPLLLF